MSSAKDLIKSHGLRVTDQRLSIVEVMSGKSSAVSYKDLANELPSSFDRVTIYRNLKSFEDKGLIHVIPNQEGELYYALCNHDHEHHHEHDHNPGNHAHFRCKKCDKIECVDGVQIHSSNLPKGYSADSYSLVIQGICNQCS